MALSNEQFDTLMRGYEQRQRKARIERDRRYEEIVQRIPSFADLNSDTSSLIHVFTEQFASGDSADTGKDTATARKALGEIEDRRRAMLRDAGFPPDYLETVYECPDCHDKGFIGSQKCHCFRQREIDLLYAQSNLDMLIADMDFSCLREDFYRQDEEALKHFRGARDHAIQFVRQFPDVEKGLLFMGNVGTGKTALSVCVAKELMNRGYSTLYFSAVSLFERLARARFGKEEDAADRLSADLFTRDLLIIDDLGSEMTNTFVTEQLFLLLNERSIRKKPLVISTNLGLGDLQKRYEDRIFSRITGQCSLYKLTGSDIRRSIL